mmetsp:Transcript_61880/g.73334  ORF Transcript_61880/g.73334 Transcript_61880/m.73334 type:complete len:628 (-) Transcript_61880:90-1973(-)|eukprot:CAMPEP_0172511364 /NCGR_PEP_ID=MMETSP1066-20121228/235740_1 /TAXON_ID=671091 /ORGANISM="Coscinodiscus wailesii, Strain CCMP2513" /LENGTH=627 /DNA_ID=CAMNT_0013290697 /DNA_START=99 /DNA_END=1982 /DNA_ORIENTATION=-
MILRARGVKPHTTPHSSSTSSLSLPPSVRTEQQTRRKSRRATPGLSKVTLSVCLGCVIFLYFAFFTSLRHASDVRRDANRQTKDETKKKKRESAREEPVDDDWDVTALRRQIRSIKDEFRERYGGEKISGELYAKGIIPLDGRSAAIGKKHISDLILSRRETNDPVSLSFGGYSVTVGRGNYFRQSYPFVLRDILAPLFESLRIPLKVHNGAIGGIPSFPYGWCLKNFLLPNPSVVNWDYGMNERNSIQGLESYIRHAVSSFTEKPILIVLDSPKKDKERLLNEYVLKGVLKDAIFLNGEDYVNKEYLKGDVPVGLQEWDVWGAPKGSPGQSPWHPKYKRHELMGWVLAMHFLEGVEMAVDAFADGSFQKVDSDGGHGGLIPPMSQLKDESLQSLLFGVNDGDQWRMNAVSCRTSFQPNLSGHLKDIVVSGMVEPKEGILEIRPDSYYEHGWTIDVGETERKTKIKVEKFGGLGYIDMKEALYGVPQSGPLELFLPYELSTDKLPHKLRHETNTAKRWFQSIVICEVSEKRGDNECDMEKNLDITVGGVPAQGVSKIGETGVEYLGKKICINVVIPEKAIVSLQPRVGLSVVVKVRGNVTRKNGACTISHVIWEHAALSRDFNSVMR